MKKLRETGVFCFLMEREVYPCKLKGFQYNCNCMRICIKKLLSIKFQDNRLK